MWLCENLSGMLIRYIKILDISKMEQTLLYNIITKEKERKEEKKREKLDLFKIVIIYSCKCRSYHNNPLLNILSFFKQLHSKQRSD